MCQGLALGIIALYLTFTVDTCCKLWTTVALCWLLQQDCWSTNSNMFRVTLPKSPLGCIFTQIIFLCQNINNYLLWPENQVVSSFKSFSVHTSSKVTQSSSFPISSTSTWDSLLNHLVHASSGLFFKRACLSTFILPYVLVLVKFLFVFILYRTGRANRNAGVFIVEGMTLSREEGGMCRTVSEHWCGVNSRQNIL